MTKRLLVSLLIVGIVSGLIGCSNLRRQALEIQDRLDDAIVRAEVAEQAAAQNATRILDLSRRIDELETSLEELRADSSGSTM